LRPWYFHLQFDISTPVLWPGTPCISKNRDRLGVAALAESWKFGVVSGFHMAWTLLNKLNSGRKPCSLIALTL
jgi:hypothetical protein